MSKGGEGHGRKGQEEEGLLAQHGAASKGAVPSVCPHGQLARVCRVCELEQEVADMRGDMLFAARACVVRLNAKDATITALRAALAQVEWVPARGDKNRHICPWCGFPKWMGHMSDCARQAALGVGRGEGE